MKAKNTSFQAYASINCGGKLVDLSTPKVMGILNITPDSFYDGGKHTSVEAALVAVEKMLTEGATFIDVGGMSSRPGAAALTPAEECARVIPIITAIAQRFPQAIVSIDTWGSTTARRAVDAGASLVNDISGGQYDEHMLTTVAQLKVPYIAMHMRGTPQNMQQQTQYNNLVSDIVDYFINLKQKCQDAGITDWIVDPGFGFAKTLEQNYSLLNQLESFHILETPLLVGISRKSMIYKALDTTASEALNGSTALHAISLLKGAKILRVHDVKEAVEVVKLTNLLANS